ncbi:hypothetical protein ILYODFUR_007514 [Ilyodon furcidens]|uniref:Uncharacterized protein n=1 Tax=Ilyodon furcidens TaxID=33524 RepID=A0ABV0U7C1_9TELE
MWAFQCGAESLTCLHFNAPPSFPYRHIDLHIDQHPLTLLTPPSNQPLTMIHLPVIKKASKTAALTQVDFPPRPGDQGIRTAASHAFLRACPGTKSYPH